MMKLIISTLVGGVILFLWGWLSWTVLPLHEASMHNINNEEAVITAMDVNMDHQGVYVFPAMPTGADQAALEEWSQKYQRGPIGMIIYNPDGAEPMMLSQMIIGLILTFISVFIASWFLSRSTAVTSNYIARVSYFGMLGIFVSVVAHLTNWNWMGYPLDYTTAWIFDTIIGWLITGLCVAAIIKVPKTETTS